MRTTPGRAAGAALLLAASVGCGIPATGAIEAGQPAEGILAPADASHPGSVYIYLVTGRRVIPVVRLSLGGDSPQAALDLLLAGPTPQESATGTTTEVPTWAAPGWVRVDRDTVRVDLAPATPRLSEPALQQIVCTVSTAGARRTDSAGAAPSVVSVATPNWRVEGRVCLDAFS